MAIMWNNSMSVANNGIDSDHQKLIQIVNNIEEAIEAEKCADYIGLGPIFHTDTKDDIREPVGLEKLKEFKLKVPIVVIGGIKMDNLRGVLQAGARNIAMISGIYDDVEKKVREVNEIIEKFS